MPRGSNARCSMYVHADVPLVGDDRFTRVHTHANTDGADGEGIAPFSRSGKRVRGSCEGDEERISLRVHLNAAVPVETLTQRSTVIREHARVGVAELVQQARRPLHVREEEGDGAGGQLGHTVMMRRLAPKV